MQSSSFDDLKKKVADLSCASSVGRVASIDGYCLCVSGLQTEVKLGDRVSVFRQDGSVLNGDVVRIDADLVTVLPDEAPQQVALSDRVVSTGPIRIAPCDGWIGRIIDPYGLPLDFRPLPQGRSIAIQNDPPPAVLRKPFGPRLETGFHLFNTLLPIVRGQRLGLFAGSGVGKSTLLADLIRQLQADVVVLALVGERGREVREFTQSVLREDGMKRTVVVAATADRAATTRQICAQTAVRVAEYFRDQRKQVLLCVDSMTRFAEAHREVAVAAGEIPSLQGFPASTSSVLTRLIERSGSGPDGVGDITSVFTVLVPKSDMDSPIADTLRGVLDGHVVLDRARAEKGQFPAVDVLQSISRALPNAATGEENKILLKARTLLSKYENASALISAGLYAEGADPELDHAMGFQKVFLQLIIGGAGSSIQSSFEALDLCLRRSKS